MINQIKDVVDHIISCVENLLKRFTCRCKCCNGKVECEFEDAESTESDKVKSV